MIKSTQDTNGIAGCEVRDGNVSVINPKGKYLFQYIDPDDEAKIQGLIKELIPEAVGALIFVEPIHLTIRGTGGKDKPYSAFEVSGKGLAE